ncbi:MAG: DNA/RNA non-specific endonuclease [Phycisphaeraceae bacterium]|nr:DNA/RNA non-specific endonuclease [Phycisphaeraceae bacterium]
MPLIARDGYVLRHSALNKEALWVCEHVRRDQLSGNLKRSDAFRPDPLLQPGDRAELTDYRGSGYDRGHMAPAGDQTVDARKKDETFYLSNMAPQEPQLNQRVWAALEDQVRDWADQRGEVWIITGPMWYDPREDDPSTARGFVDYWVIGANEVAVPTHCYKIVIRPDGNGDVDCVAFVIENKPGYRAPFHLDEYITSVDFIEKRTGLNFMPNLSPPAKARLENSPGHM